jgi:hypothetical protein
LLKLNGDGKVNFDDYTLIDQAFNNQGDVLSRAITPGRALVRL